MLVRACFGDEQAVEFEDTRDDVLLLKIHDCVLQDDVFPVAQDEVDKTAIEVIPDKVLAKPLILGLPRQTWMDHRFYLHIVFSKEAARVLLEDWLFVVGGHEKLLLTKLP